MDGGEIFGEKQQSMREKEEEKLERRQKRQDRRKKGLHPQKVLGR